MSAPEKTGAVLYSSEYGCFWVSDAFKFGDAYVFHIRNQGRWKRSETGDVFHYTVRKIAHSFDENNIFGYLICLATDVTYHGYEGIPA